MQRPSQPNASFDRRLLLQRCAVGFGHLAFSSMLATSGPANADDVNAGRASSSLDRPHHLPRAKRVIFLFMKGGPSHVDTFDPKPLLDRDHGKPLPFDLPRVTFAKQGNLLRSPWKFHRHGESGLPVSELFPNVAKHADQLCVLRSVHGTNPAHGGASLKLHTGTDQFVRPSMGSWLVYGLGSENSNLPAFITICPTLAHGGVNNWGAAFLPAHCQGTPIGNASQLASRSRIEHMRHPELSIEQQRRQLDFISAMNQEHIAITGSNKELSGRLKSFELAFRMQTEMPSIQDLSSETAATQALYGLDDPVTADFGHQCVLARRFAEQGVRFIQVTHSDSEVQWDQHGNLYQGHAKNAAEVDKPIAGLLTDLKQRGLLEDTLVLWGGEFGRTPTAQGNNGRDHNPHGFTMWMAGGGVKGGFAYGATDDYGYYAQQDKMHIHDLHATLLHLMGIDHERLTYRHAGRDFRLTDVAGKVAKAIFA
ncbi:DUF1501 domain-containing protein [Stieleria sp. JC731]|uniref:DUF1501 domain-containing protein n=1 Tax=Pirellulaceae TaxID=2691357 RepID=UPI001E344F90|nr:DUF1501 domain-containing protein [Stieleria sp. JC731]MCC9603237.1 DUF1501 domain-containing protein [Stieleria sp. JC731]